MIPADSLPDSLDQVPSDDLALLFAPPGLLTFDDLARRRELAHSRDGYGQRLFELVSRYSRTDLHQLLIYRGIALGLPLHAGRDHSPFVAGTFSSLPMAMAVRIDD
jgi:hypothetical protein